MRFDSKMPMVEDVCRLQWLDVRTCPIVSVALVRVHLPWWQQLIHRFHVWQRNECYLQIIITMSMHRADNVIYRNKCKINSKIEKEPFCFYCDHNGDLAWVFKWARTEQKAEGGIIVSKNIPQSKLWDKYVILSISFHCFSPVKGLKLRASRVIMHFYRSFLCVQFYPFPLRESPLLWFLQKAVTHSVQSWKQSVIGHQQKITKYKQNQPLKF